MFISHLYYTIDQTQLSTPRVLKVTSPSHFVNISTGCSNSKTISSFPLEIPRTQATTAAHANLFYVLLVRFHRRISPGLRTLPIFSIGGSNRASSRFRLLVDQRILGSIVSSVTTSRASGWSNTLQSYTLVYSIRTYYVNTLSRNLQSARWLGWFIPKNGCTWEYQTYKNRVHRMRISENEKMTECPEG